MPKRTLPSGIRPHNHRELELMLSGMKPMALFAAEAGMDAEDIGDAQFKPFVDEGRILKFTYVDPNLHRRASLLPADRGMALQAQPADLSNVPERRGLWRLHVK
ncbi:hypothetical protein LB524_21320 [Mesorhizobium sp. ESP6-5]|uniref:hypothetical protein n=1 Tax=Mesorhizobium sp. ESP6-5 TaxID=2876623 RepID=UPI001CCDFEF5|nr:hypothetical protein [Mesorhizobium sp. ESP6-5]MBZ9757831.1 hypothetical protein [Mesorhizobium sp. ESP6-5]